MSAIRISRFCRILSVLVLLLFVQPLEVKADDVLGMDLAELMDIEVYSASKKMERAADAPAAVFVITAEDIRRSTAQSIPEILRIVPGLHVARISANAWSVSVRGFSGLFANKLLVLIDGRSVYNSVFSGVYWNVQDTMLEDVERIEVIRGPGGALWGANAVNGVINIITKNSADTKGALASLGGGSENRGIAALRYGGSLENGSWRAYAKVFDREDSENAFGSDSQDETEGMRLGFRADLDLSEKDTLQLQGDLFTVNERSHTNDIDVTSPSLFSPLELNSDHDGGNIIGRWNRELSETSALQLQIYYNREDRRARGGENLEEFVDFYMDTYDVDLQHRTALMESHELTWGLGFRQIEDNILGRGQSFDTEPQRDSIQILSGYAQDAIRLSESVRLILGAKLSYHDYSGFEYQPNIRTIWSPSQDSSIWAAISRAVRTPSAAEERFSGPVDALTVPGVGIIRTDLEANPGSESENLLAYELGVRSALTRSLQLDLSLFYFDYSDVNGLVSAEPSFGTVDGVPFEINRASLANVLDVESYGSELLINYQATPWMRFHASHTFFKTSTRGDTGNALANTNPQHQAGLRALIDLPFDVELDGFFRYVDSLEDSEIGSYEELDIRLGWRVNEYVALDLIGNNLLDSSHSEFEGNYPTPSLAAIERSIFGRVTVRLQ